MNARLGIIVALVLSINLTAIADDQFTIERIESAGSGNSVSVHVTGSGAPVFDTYSIDDPERVIVRFTNGVLPDRPVEMSYGYPVKRLDLQRDIDGGYCVKLVCEIDNAVTFNARQAEDGVTLGIELGDTPSKEVIPPENHTPSWMMGTVNVDFEHTPLSSALSLLSKQHGFDVVMSDLEDREVTAHVSGVTVKDALDAVMSVTGYSYFTVGDIVVVKPVSDETPGEMVTRVFNLNYIDARQVQSQIANMLTSRGKAEVISDGQRLGEGSSANYPATTIAVTDLASSIPLIEEFISRIDSKPRQVSIAVKLIETTLTDDQSFGLDWQTDLTSKITGAEGDNTSGEIAPERLSAVATLPLRSGSFSYGTLTFSEVSLLLEFLKTAGKSRLLSSPSVTTTDGKPAIIDVVTTIPIQTVNRFSEGAVIQDIVTFQYKDVGITLSVTPIINKDGFITLKCVPTVEEITGWVGPADNQQPITSKRSVNTDVIVKSGETLVIGGLMKESTIEKVNGIWLLSDIPIIGELFRHHDKQNSKTDLMILITPAILP